ncbi:hypothetical protein HYH03_008094 [Edaphochlamys debaryana]|uniref:Myb-binding protein 1A n=1 Tax=Edaphochlamys debaryana TaxID=47281 RepID=A0A835Y0M6_9CHLO|nr:hypothetical protein HYH03_008094 [Edaphochlamys debaryana]|eukprot:KAG2493575.1 hypothetical protein HYH03_008094 [Edaphochlamys debaryana]
MKDKEPPTGGDGDEGALPSTNALTTSQAVLKYFWDLASYDEEVRVAAAKGLVADVCADQAKHAAGLGKDTTAAPEEGAPRIQLLEYHLRRCSPTLVYTLRRLARGLGSSRQAARQGYAAALAGLLGGSKAVSPAGVLVLLEVCIDGSTKGGDAKETLLGRLFGFGALLRSGLPLDAATVAGLFNGLLTVGARKSFLREAATTVALEAAARMDAAGVAALAAYGQPLAQLLAAPPADATAETLMLALALWPKLPAAAVRACRLLPPNTPPPPPELFAAGTPPASVAAAAAATAAGLFTREHVAVLTPALLATSAAHPRMHSLWGYVLPLLLPGYRPHKAAAAGGDLAVGPAPGAEQPAPATTPGAKAMKKGAKGAANTPGAASAAGAGAGSKGLVSSSQLEMFWSAVVEGGMMDSSHERRYLGFQLFSRVLPHLRPEHVSVVFSPNLTRTLANSVKRGDSYLHASSRKLLDNISGFLERSEAAGGADRGVKLAVAAALQRLGGIAPRELAGGKLTRKLVQGLDAAGVRSYAEALQEAFLAGRPPLQAPGEAEPAGNGHAAGEEAEEGTDATTVTAERRGAAMEQLLSALRFPAAADADAQGVLRFMAVHAFLDVKQAKASKSKLPELQSAAKLASPLAPTTRSVCASRLVTLLSHLSHAVQARQRAAQQAAQQQATAAAAGTEPAAKKRKTGAGAAEAGGEAAAAAAAAAPPPPPSTVNAPLHETLAFVRKALAAPGVELARPLGEDGDTSLSLLAAVEGAALEALETADKQQAGARASRLRALAALCAHLQLQLLAEPEGFEADLPLSLRRVGAEGLGLQGLPEVEEMVEGDDEGGKDAPGPSGSWGDVLVDVMLAVLARPGGALPIAPLREAAETLWRQCCDEGVSAEGVADIARVVAAGGKGEGQDAAGLFESDEEEEEGSEDEDEEESDEEEDEVEEEAPAKQKGKQTPGKKEERKRKGGSEEEEEEVEEDEEGGDGAGKAGSEEEESEDMDDEAMFRMDEKLAAYFRSIAGGRAGSAAAAERASALVNFRLRALALLEALAKKAPHSPLLLTALVPLVRALATASRPGGQPQVAARLKGVLANKLCKCRAKLVDPAPLGGVEGYAGALKRLLYEASRSRDRAVAATALAAYNAMLRAGAAAGEEQPEVSAAAQASFRAALEDLLSKKKTRLHPEGLVASFQAAPAACLPSLGLLLQRVGDGRSAHVRVQAAGLLARLARSPPEGMAAAVAVSATGHALGGALAACAAGVGLKREAHAKAAKAAVGVAESLRKLAPGKRAAEVLGSDTLNAVAKAVATVRSLEPAPGVAKALQRLVDTLALGPLMEKTKADPALASKITKAAPAKPAAPEQPAKKAGKEAGKGKDKEGKKEAKAKKEEKKRKGRQAEEDEEEESEEAEEEEDAGSDDEEEVGLGAGSSDEEGDEEEEDDDEGPSSSGEGDEEESEDDEEAQAPRKGGAKGKGKAGPGGKGAGAKQRAQGPPGKGKQKGKPQGGGGEGPGGRKPQKAQGGSPAKKARR